MNKLAPLIHRRFYLLALGLSLVHALPYVSVAHETIVHKQITLHAALLLSHNSPGYNALLLILIRNCFVARPLVLDAARVMPARIYRHSGGQATGSPATIDSHGIKLASRRTARQGVSKRTRQYRREAISSLLL